jgi:acetyl-CoA carboxylase carboxyltransferase component
MEEDEREEFEAAAKAEYEKYVDIRKQAGKMQVDELVPAGDLREQLLNRLRTFRTKRRTERDRYHGTVLH